jgi:hypothetical protein
MPLTQKRPILSDIPDNKPLILETWVAPFAPREKEQVLLLALQKANNIFLHAFLTVILGTFFNMRLCFAFSDNISHGQS